MDRFFVIVFSLIVLITADPAVSSAGIIITDDENYLNYGNNFGYVGWMDVSSTQASTAFGGSATLIDPHWVAFTGHQARLVDSDPLSLYDSFVVGFGSNNFTDRGETQTASQVFVHPDYNGLPRGADLALL